MLRPDLLPPVMGRASSSGLVILSARAPGSSPQIQLLYLTWVPHATWLARWGRATLLLWLAHIVWISRLEWLAQDRRHSRTASASRATR